MRQATLLLGIFILAVPLYAQPGKKVVFVRSSTLSLYEQAVKGFQRCTKSAVAGDFIMTDDAGKTEAMANDISARGPDLIVPMGSTAVRFVRERFKSTPSVFGMVIDPGSNGINPPGVPLDLSASAQIGFIQTAFPQFKRIAVLYSPQKNKETVEDLKQIQAKGTIQLVLTEVPSIDKLDAAVRGLLGKADCFLMLSDPVLYSPQTAPQVILQTLQMGLPIIAPSPAYVKAGALAGVYSDAEENGCAAAESGERILAGDKKESTQFSWSGKARSAVNMVVADRLKIKVAPSVVSGAEQVVK